MPAPNQIAPTGRLSGTNADAFEVEMLAALEGDAPGLIVDLGGLEYISSAGLRVLLLTAKAAKKKGKTMALAAAKPLVAEALQLGGFDEIIPTHATVDAALAAFR